MDTNGILGHKWDFNVKTCMCILPILTFGTVLKDTGIKIGFFFSISWIAAANVKHILVGRRSLMKYPQNVPADDRVVSHCFLSNLSPFVSKAYLFRTFGSSFCAFSGTFAAVKILEPV